MRKGVKFFWIFKKAERKPLYIFSPTSDTIGVVFSAGVVNTYREFTEENDAILEVNTEDV